MAPGNSLEKVETTGNGRKQAKEVLSLNLSIFVSIHTPCIFMYMYIQWECLMSDSKRTPLWRSFTSSFMNGKWVDFEQIFPMNGSSRTAALVERPEVNVHVF